MAYADLTTRDPNRIKRWIKRNSYADALGVFLDEVAHNGGISILDYGGGDGELCLQCLSARPDIQASIFEPMPTFLREAKDKLKSFASVNYATSLDDLADKTFDVVFCVEVFEHLPPEQTIAAILAIRRLLSPEGHAIVGVPYEIFLPALFKGLFRMTRRFGQFDALPINVLKAAIGRPPSGRPVSEITEGYPFHVYHLGFDHRVLRSALCKHFSLTKTWYGPVRGLRGVLNSEVYFHLRHKTR